MLEKDQAGKESERRLRWGVLRADFEGQVRHCTFSSGRVEEVDYYDIYM